MKNRLSEITLTDEFAQKLGRNYTKEEYLVNKIMYAADYRYLIGLKHILYYGFNSILAILYLAFIIKLYNCLA